MTGIETMMAAKVVGDLTVGTMLTIGGGLMTAVNAISQGNAAAASANYNARVAENNAIAVRQQAAADEARQRRLAAKRSGSLVAGYGATGVTVEGSPLDIMEESAMQEELDALTIRYNGELAASNFMATAGMERARASNARTSGYMGAGTALLMTGAKVAGTGPSAGLNSPGMYNGGTGTNPLTGLRYGGV